MSFEVADPLSQRQYRRPTNPTHEDGMTWRAHVNCPAVLTLIASVSVFVGVFKFPAIAEDEAECLVVAQ